MFKKHYILLRQNDRKENRRGRDFLLIHFSMDIHLQHNYFNMNPVYDNLVRALNFIFVFVFIVHITTIVYQDLNPRHPSIKSYSKDLKDIEFPISFKLCVGERENATDKFRRLGYTNEMDFYHGRSRFNETILGWNGHTETMSTVGSIEG